MRRPFSKITVEKRANLVIDFSKLVENHSFFFAFFWFFLCLLLPRYVVESQSVTVMPCVYEDAFVFIAFYCILKGYLFKPSLSTNLGESYAEPINFQRACINFTSIRSIFF